MGEKYPENNAGNKQGVHCSKKMCHLLWNLPNGSIDGTIHSEHDFSNDRTLFGLEYWALCQYFYLHP